MTWSTTSCVFTYFLYTSLWGGGALTRMPGGAILNPFLTQPNLNNHENTRENT